MKKCKKVYLKFLVLVLLFSLFGGCIGDKKVNLESIEIISPLNKTEYFIGEEFDITGLSVEGSYSDGSKNIEEITIENISGFDNTKAGIEAIIVTVKDKSIKFSIKVIDAVSKAEFNLIRKVELMDINEYSAEFEVYDSKIKKLIFTGTALIEPMEVEIIDKKAAISRMWIGSSVSAIKIKGIDENGNQVGNIKNIEFTN